MIKLNLFLTNVDRLNLSFGFVGIHFIVIALPPRDSWTLSGDSMVLVLPNSAITQSVRFFCGRSKFARIIFLDKSCSGRSNWRTSAEPIVSRTWNLAVGMRGWVSHQSHKLGNVIREWGVYEKKKPSFSWTSWQCRHAISDGFMQKKNE